MIAQFDMKRINALKDIIVRLRNSARVESILEDFKQHFREISVVDLLLIELELINGEYGITVEDIQMFSDVYPYLNDHIIATEKTFDTDHPSHPIQIFKEEN